MGMKWRKEAEDQRRRAELAELRIASLLNVIQTAVMELDAEHVPQWSSEEMKAKGKEPIGCNICFAADGSWPCITRLITDELRGVL